MTGAGAATVAFALETDYLGALETDVDGNVKYWQPGKDIEVTELSLQNQLQRISDPGDPEALAHIAGNLEGALGVTFTLAGDDWHQTVFNDGTATGFVDGRMAYSRWFFGVDYLDGTAERAAKGAVVSDASVQYQQGQVSSVTLTLLYGDEENNTSITPSGIQSAGESDIYNFSGANLDVDAVTQARLETAELSMALNPQFHRGPQRTPLDATLGNVETTLSTDAVYTGPSQQEIAYGGAQPASSIDAVNATLSFENRVPNTITYNLSGAKPDTYAWQNLVGEENLTEPITYNVDSVGVA